MSTIRAFSNSKRVSTGRVTKDGRFFQAYPTHMYYVNEVAWRDEWTKKSSTIFQVDGSATTTEPYQYSKNTTATLPAGRYYIGDLCYALKRSVYMDVFGGNGNGYLSGHYKMDDGEFLVDRTAWGDGSYFGSNNYAYGVDAAIIGIANISICCPEKDVYGGTLHTFTEPVKCSFKNGRFEFSSGSWYLEIDTTYQGDDDRSDC